jgi:hypothetical protein
MSEKPMTVLRSMNKRAKLTIFYVGAMQFSFAPETLNTGRKGLKNQTIVKSQQLFCKTFGDGKTFVYFCTPKIHDGQRR